MTLENGELLVYNVTAEDLNVTFQCLTKLANEVYASPLTRYNYINDIYQTFIKNAKMRDFGGFLNNVFETLFLKNGAVERKRL